MIVDKSVAEIAQDVGGKVVGDGTVRITGLNAIKEATAGELSFLGQSHYEAYLEKTEASAVFVTPHYAEANKPLIQVENPYAAFAQMLQVVEAELLVHPKGIHATAVIGDNVRLGDNVALDAHAVVSDNCEIGDNVVIYAGVYLGRGVSIGSGTVIHANCSIRAEATIGSNCLFHSNVSIGSDGFGLTQVGGERVKIPHIGTVLIEDNVEIGANSAVDRATCGTTFIGRGTKIDNLVQVGHNSRIGEHCALSSGTAIGGSAVLGNFVTMGGQSGAAGPIEIGNNVMVAGRAGVIKSIKEGQVVSGFPARDHARQMRVLASQSQLPEALKRLKVLEEKLKGIEERKNG